MKSFANNNFWFVNSIKVNNVCVQNYTEKKKIETEMVSKWEINIPQEQCKSNGNYSGWRWKVCNSKVRTKQ